MAQVGWRLDICYQDMCEALSAVQVELREVGNGERTSGNL